MTNQANTTDYDIHDNIREILLNAGFMPIEYAEPDADDEVHLTIRDAGIIRWYAERGWNAFRIEPAAAAESFTLARWTDDRIEIETINENGVTMAEARFSANATGAAWASRLLYDA